MDSEVEHANHLADESLAEALNLSFRILKGVMVLLVLLFLGSGVFIVEQDEVALVMRFGDIVMDSKGNRELKSGAHWTFPFPVSKVVKITKKRQSLTITDFWYHEDPELDSKRQRRLAPETLDPETDGYCLTSDANILHVEKIEVLYTIENAYEYATNHENPEDLLHNVILNATICSIASFSINDARTKTDALIEEAKRRIQSRLANIKLGIEINSLTLRVIPPLKVQNAFDSVSEAFAAKSKNLEAAKGYRTMIENKAESEADSIVKDAKNLKERIIKGVQSDAKYLESIVERFKETPEIYKEIHYNKALAEISADIKEIFILSTNTQNRELRLHLNRDPELRKKNAPDGQEPDIREKKEE